VSKKAEQALKDKVKTLEIHKRTGSTIGMIAEVINPILRGWMNCFSKVRSLCNETRVRLCAKASDKVGYVQVQKSSGTPSESRRMAMSS
jgi:hypothetical protein